MIVQALFAVVALSVVGAVAPAVHHVGEPGVGSVFVFLLLSNTLFCVAVARAGSTNRHVVNSVVILVLKSAVCFHK